MENYDPSDSEYGKLKSWIDISLQLPFDNVKELKTDNQTNFIKYIKESLDTELYGLTEVKEQILLFLNSRMNNPNLKGCNLALLGEPGCGKTALSRSLSRILDLPFSQISFGGINDVNFLKGHDLTYIGSKPGEIAQSMIRLKNKNGILFLDEFDKVSNNSDIISSLLHVTDPEQNHSYRDNYLSDLVIDLSSVWWIYSMNEYPKNKALKDRLFIIKLPEYSVNDKVNIIKKFSIKKILKTLGLEDDTFTISDEACNCIINNYIDSSDKGIRNIQKILSDVIQKLLFKYKHKDEITLSVKTNNVTLPYEISSKDIRKLVKNDKKNMNYMYV
jgi:ATP-dependent Lon protease